MSATPPVSEIADPTRLAGCSMSSGSGEYRTPVSTGGIPQYLVTTVAAFDGLAAMVTCPYTPVAPLSITDSMPPMISTKQA